VDFRALTAPVKLLMDALVEQITRTVAMRTSRRGILGLLGKLILGAALLPLLPVERISARANGADEGDPLSCDYWRYCGFDGALCGCCGGSTTECPPGTMMSPTSWVGTCKHPVDGKDYMIGYRDCCGKDECGKCFCQNNKGDMPLYRTQLDNGVTWCFGTSSFVVNCTTAVNLGLKS
jgi:methylamine dehydrogenase light chain